MDPYPIDHDRRYLWVHVSRDQKPTPACFIRLVARR